MDRSATAASSLLGRQLGLAAELLASDAPPAVATLVDAEGSSPFAPGVFMLIGPDGRLEGSITGGCIESELAGLASELLDGAGPARMLTYGIADDLAQSAGLMCGGTVHVLLRVPRAEERRVLALAWAAAAEDRPVVVATLLDGERAGATMALVDGEVHGSLGSGALLDSNVDADLRGALRGAGSTIRHYGADGATLGTDLRVHIHSYLPAPRMLIVGAVDYAAAVATAARTLGYAVTIVDARPAFAASNRFSRAARVVVGWPQEVIPDFALTERDVALVLTHDRRFDEPALQAALASRCGYIGALGSRRTTADRRRRLAELGVPDSELERIHGPCGLDIGAASPEEVAISILAEVIASRASRGGGPLRDAAGAIRDRPADAALSRGPGAAP